MGDVTPDGYCIKHTPRQGRIGGGVAVIHKNNCHIDLLKPSLQSEAFEHMEFMLQSGNGRMRVVLLYRLEKPHPDLDHTVPFSVFLKDFSNVVQPHVVRPGHLLVAGDFNIHMDVLDDQKTKRFQNVIDSMDLDQLVHEPTHEKGHTLDLVITRKSEESFISDIYVGDRISDHNAVLFKCGIQKPPPIRKNITFRKLKNINVGLFKNDLKDRLATLEKSHVIEGLVDQYDSTLSSLTDHHAPEITRTVTIRHHTPWYNDEIREERKERRRLERAMRKTKTNESEDAYKTQRNKVEKLCTSTKTTFYQNILKNNSDPKCMYKVLDTVLNRKQTHPLPPHDSAESLANEFADAFIGKIEKIREKLSNDRIGETDEPKRYHTELQELHPTNIDELREIITTSPVKSCELDPAPSWLVKDCLDELLPLLVDIVNLSFESGQMPTSLKQAHIRPLLKKAILDLILKNFRPVSNLTYLSKIIERVAAKRLIAHQNVNGLQEVYQSAYRQYHSTETALLKVQDDIFQAMDNQEVVLLVLLDLSAAFDTIDHDILIRRLRDQYGVTGTALQWFQSYLSDRTQTVVVEGQKSSTRPLAFGVPQGSVLGPELFKIYFAPAADIARKHGLKFHFYADDGQDYIAFKPIVPMDAASAIFRLRACLDELRQWLRENFLSCNDTKTEFIIIGTWQQLLKVNIDGIRIGDAWIQPKESVRNLGVMFDSNMNMKDHVTSICQSGYYHLKNLTSVRKYLDRSTTELGIHAFVTSRLDMGNSLLYGICKKQIHRLQLLQNMAARTVVMKRKYDHITPVLYHLHWLPVSYRIKYKVLVTVYKALNDMTPSYLSDLIKIKSKPRSLRSNSKFLLEVPKVSLKSAGNRAFSHAGPSLFNELPEDIKTVDTLEVFKSRLKTHLFNQAFNGLEEYDSAE